MRKEAHYHPKIKMSQDMLTNLPSEIILDIILRLPLRTMMSCKCVCKSWLDFLRTPEFVKSHLSKSVQGLIIFQWKALPKGYKFVEFTSANLVFNFDLPFEHPSFTSANGLILCKRGYFEEDIFICNPVTREYIKLPPPRQPSVEPHEIQIENYGFGVSRMTGQYKVVNIFMDGSLPRRYECQVYTVGSGSWRKKACSSLLVYDTNMDPVFLNGNLHWFASEQISCFDLETECFSTFSHPASPRANVRLRNLSFLGDCLCICDCSRDEFDVWLMKEYGDEKSWTKEYVIRTSNKGYYRASLCPIKVLKDGGILMVSRGSDLLYYSAHSESIEEAYFNEEKCSFCRMPTIFTPSFISLKTFAMENVISF